MASADRAQIEAFAREIHAATNIPMFSPKTFADLFRILAERGRPSTATISTTPPRTSPSA